MDSTPRLPIRRTRVLCADDLTPDACRDLARELRPAFEQSFGPIEEQAFVDTFVKRGPGSKIAVFHGPEGEVAGFSSACVIRLEVGGVEHAVFHAGVFIHPSYRGGDAAARFGLAQALRLRLAKPWLRVWYIAGTTSPAPYALYGRTLNRFYPHPELEAPPEVAEIVEAFKAKVGLTSVDGHPHLVSHDRWPRLSRAGQARHARSLRDDDLAAFFLRVNPRFEEGTRLLVCIPLDLANVTAGLLAPLRARLRALAAPSAPAALPELAR